jgi:hypothetical protein
MYNAIDAAEFSRERDHDASPRREKRILYAGAVPSHKGPARTVRCFLVGREGVPETRLDVVGSQASYPLAEIFGCKIGT